MSRVRKGIKAASMNHGSSKTLRCWLAKAGHVRPETVGFVTSKCRLFACVVCCVLRCVVLCGVCKECVCGGGVWCVWCVCLCLLKTKQTSHVDPREEACDILIFSASSRIVHHLDMKGTFLRMFTTVVMTCLVFSRFCCSHHRRCEGPFAQWSCWCR